MRYQIIFIRYYKSEKHFSCLANGFYDLSCNFCKVLRILEGDMVMDSNYMPTLYDVGCRSGRIWSENQQQKEHYSGPLDEALEGYGKLSLENSRPAFWERDKARRTSSCEDHL